MKTIKLLIIITLIFFSLQTSAQTIKVNWQSFTKVAQDFRQTQKPVFIFLYTNNSDSCRQMFDSVFSLNEVSNYINVLTYPIKLDIESTDTITFFDGRTFTNTPGNNRYHELSYELSGTIPTAPSIIVFDKSAKGQVFTGFKSRDELFSILIYFTENVSNVMTYAEFSEYYFKAYPKGQSQTVTRLLIKWKTLNEAVELQKSEPRKILIDMYYNFSITATMMRTTTYNNPKIAAFLNQYFHVITLDPKEPADIDFAGVHYINEKATHGFHQFAIAALEGKMQFPALLILDENYKLLDRIQRYMRPEDIEPIIYYYQSNAYKTQTYPDFLKTFKSNL